MTNIDLQKQFTNKDAINVKEHIYLLREQSIEINYFFTIIENIGETVLIGGAIRDIFYGTKPRDFDIIINSEAGRLEDKLQEKLGGLLLKRNRFGGYKFCVDKYIFDVWSIYDNWAFKTDLLDAKIDNIKEGAFFNIDSLVLCLKDDSFYCNTQLFNDSIRNKCLDIISSDYIDSNPFPSINIMRALVLKNKFELDFSPQLKQYIIQWYEKTTKPINEMINAQLKHYGNSKHLKADEISFAFDRVLM